MFRKLVIIGIVIGMAGMAMSAKYIGNPTSSNGWSTTSKVTCVSPEGYTTWITEIWTVSEPASIVNGVGLDPATGTKSATGDWVGKEEDTNSTWNSSYCMQNKSTSGATSGGLGYYQDAPYYDADMTAGKVASLYDDGGLLWFAFEFDTTYYVGDMFVWNFNEVPDSLGTWVKPEYSTKAIRVSYTEDGQYWNEKKVATLSAGTRLSWTRGNNSMLADSVEIGGNANVVVITATNNYFTGTQNKYRAGLAEVRFQYDPNYATAPNPSDTGSKFINCPLTWTAGKGATIVKHKVYISTDKAAVDGRTASSTIVTTASYTPTVVTGNPGIYYYWAVDELNSSNAVVSEGSGRTWRFTATDIAKVDDFESYTIDTGSNPIYNTWVDGWVPSGNYPNGGWVQMLPYNYGYKQMKLNYDNDGTWNDEYPTPWNPIDNNYSEVTAQASNLAIGADWTIGDVAAIWVWFTSDAGNDNNEPLSMILTDNSSNSDSVLYPTKAHLSDGASHAWRIDLADFSGVNLANIKSVTIRIGDGGSISGTGNGFLVFDDFRLYPPRCEGLMSTVNPTTAQGDLNDDCVIDMKDLGILVNNWLAAGTNP